MLIDEYTDILMSRAWVDLKDASRRGNEWAAAFLNLDQSLQANLMPQIVRLQTFCDDIGPASAVEILYRLGRWERNQSKVDRRRFERVMLATQAEMY